MIFKAIIIFSQNHLTLKSILSGRTCLPINLPTEPQRDPTSGKRNKTKKLSDAVDTSWATVLASDKKKTLAQEGGWMENPTARHI
jgi:hypothetical protein